MLDIGCNLGMMMAEYLRMGARWCHGWDTGEITPHAERMLLAIGCTRFSLTGAWLDGNRDLVQDLPEFLRSRLDGCIISYLAVRGTLGWMEALASIPWKAIIYEGHEDETIEQFHEFLAGLRAKVAFDVGPVDSIRDGDCDARTLAILLRK